MAYKDLEPISKQLTIVIGLTVVGFMAFGLAFSFYRNVLFEETLQNFAAQNEKLRDDIKKTRDSLEYYKSRQFRDKYAKETLSKSAPGEKVLVLSQDPSMLSETLSENASEEDLKEAVYQEILNQMPVIEHWNLYFFHRDKVDELKRVL